MDHSQPNQHHLSRELNDLLSQLCESGLSAVQMQRFEQLVLGNSDAGRRVIQYLQLDGHLRSTWEARQLADNVAEGASLTPTSPLPVNEMYSKDSLILEDALHDNPAAQGSFLEFCQLNPDLSVGIFADIATDHALGRIAEGSRQAPSSTSSESKGIGQPASAVSPRAAREAGHIRNAFSHFGTLQFSPSLPATFLVSACLLMVMGGIVGWWLRGDGHASSRDLVAARPQIVPVAKLTYANGCTWGDVPLGRRAIDQEVRQGDEIVLHEGIAEFRLSSGVSISVEGPSALVLTSPTSFVLQHGTTTVYVPQDVKNFRLVAGACRLTGSGVEFGVQLVGAKINVHTFSGRVLATPTLPDGQVTEVGAEIPPIDREENLPAGAEFNAAYVKAGRCLALTDQDFATVVSSWHPADESKFAIRLTMAGPLPITPAYVDSVMKSKPLGYWRFESLKKGEVANELGPQGNLVVAGKLYLAGNKSNHAVEFGRPGFEGALCSKNEINLPAQSDYSVEVWIKPSHFHGGAILNFNDSQGGTALYLQTLAVTSRPAQKRVRFLHRDPPGTDSATGTNCYSSDPYRVRRWQYVVAVKRSAEMKLYIDGVLSDSKTDPSPISSHLAMIVGQLGQIKGLEAFFGQLDELAIYPHALTEEEIKKRFALVDSQSSATDLEIKGI